MCLCVSDESGSGQSGVQSKRSRLVEGEAGQDVVVEAAVEGVQVLSELCVVEGQRSSLVVQKHSDPERLNGDPHVCAPAVVQELVLVSEEKRSGY